MVSSVEQGGATAIKTNGLVIGGKTGTAEIEVDGPTHGWFISFAGKLNQPAESPNTAAKAMAKTLAAGASNNETRAPASKRDARSRPSSSVPKKCFAPGNASVSSRNCWS